MQVLLFIYYIYLMIFILRQKKRKTYKNCTVITNML